MTTRDHGIRGAGDNRHWNPERRQKAFDLAKTGMSARDIGVRVGATRCAVIGQMNRHLQRPAKKDKQTAKSVGSIAFVGPSAPRRFSWEEGV